ncbi:CLUMA_CG012844, isoform A [Clunio marinus]|uniref:CLUMA_CG012844, isoform A n=1 Tax=Clunio marinus TaxID=568069 RepID=A0A1J1IGZ8_9DIPT|nr:CLUMA_CG012844, isoform A [Clunio marinus]
MPYCSNIEQVSSMKGKLSRIHAVYCLMVQIFIVIMLSTLIYYFVKAEHFHYGKIIPVIFFMNCFAISINLVYISWYLPSVFTSWSDFEAKYSEDDEKLTTKPWKFFSFFMTVAFLEHFVSKVVDYEGASFCFHFHSTKFEAFSRGIIPDFFKVVPYSHLYGFYVVFTQTESIMQSIYFWFSFVFLISRTMAVLWNGSLVYQESKVIIRIINNVPSEFYYREVKFFQHYAESETIAMSSFGIFDITKSSILEVR